jgi:hypothetical protein
MLDSSFYLDEKVKLNFLFIFPFIVLVKALRTVCRFLGIGMGLFVLVSTLGGEEGRSCFFKRVESFARDLADWVVFPFAVIRSIATREIRRVSGR